MTTPEDLIETRHDKTTIKDSVIDIPAVFDGQGNYIKYPPLSNPNTSIPDNPNTIGKNEEESIVSNSTATTTGIRTQLSRSSLLQGRVNDMGVNPHRRFSLHHDESLTLDNSGKKKELLSLLLPYTPGRLSLFGKLKRGISSKNIDKNDLREMRKDRELLNVNDVEDANIYHGILLGNKVVELIDSRRENLHHVTKHVDGADITFASTISGESMEFPIWKSINEKYPEMDSLLLSLYCRQQSFYEMITGSYRQAKKSKKESSRTGKEKKSEENRKCPTDFPLLLGDGEKKKE